MQLSHRDFILIILAIFASAALVFGASFVRAQPAGVEFPIAELGGCTDEAACRTYCDDFAHVNECVAFAEEHDLMSDEEAEDARAFAKLGGVGPGGCTSPGACENYCENVTHIRECLAFAEANDVLPKDELEEARAIVKALDGGAELPGGCTSKASCEAYCEDPAHIRQCLDFAKKAGFTSGEELEEAEKIAAYLDQGGQMPGGCRGEDECKAYCESGDHMNECAEFAIKAGFMSEKEAEMFRKTGGMGPGGCRGRECEAYCQDEAHREECVAFALEHDLMSEEDKQRMEEGREQAKQALEKAPPEVLECIEERVGPERVKAIRDGEALPDPKLGEILPACFREVMGDEPAGGSFGGMPPEAAKCMREVFGDDFQEKMRTGAIDPGARDDEIRECVQKQMGEDFRFTNKEGDQEFFKGERQDARPPMGSEGQFQGPGGCSSPEECRNFCSEHQEECGGFRPPMGNPGGPPQGEMWQGPPGNEEERRMMEEKYRQEFKGEFDERRFEMEREFRGEMREGMPPGGPMPPEGFAPPGGGEMAPPEPRGDEVSMRSGFLANVLTVVAGLLGL